LTGWKVNSSFASSAGQFAACPGEQREHLRDFVEAGRIQGESEAEIVRECKDFEAAVMPMK
jgi:hypothetical protein